MRIGASMVLVSICVFLIAAGATYVADGAEIRSAVADGDYTWTDMNFPGFYFDADSDIGTEELTATITDGRWLSGDAPYGLVYVTTAQTKRFGHSPWGTYKAIGFLGRPFFAGYAKDAALPSQDQIMLKESGEMDLLSITQIREVLIDNDTEITLTTGAPLKLGEGYELSIKSVDEQGQSLILQLARDGQVVDARSISPFKSSATESERTYSYSIESSGGNKIAIIAAHFRNAFSGADLGVATVSGLWQISEKPLDISADSVFDKMTVQTVDSANGQIVLSNKDYRITLEKGKDITLMPGIGLKTADSDTMRYYIYKSLNKPGTYEIRGSMASGDFLWSAQNFPGFYYDLDGDLGTEVLSATITEGNTLSGDSPYGLVYQTMAQMNELKFQDWGYYKLIGFMGKGYFAGYAQSSDLEQYQQILRSNSKSPELLGSGELSEILYDDDTEKTVPKGSSLKLKDGYELLVKGINQDGGAYLELLKDGKTVDSKVLAPSMEGATMADKTYWYARSRGGSNIVTLAVHLKNVYRDEDIAAATVDGIWQISDQSVPVKVGSKHGLMSVESYSADSISMANRDNAIMLSKNKDVTVMPGLSIRVADNDTLRYYPYATMTVNESITDNTSDEVIPPIEPVVAENISTKIQKGSTSRADPGI